METTRSKVHAHLAHHDDALRKQILALLLKLLQELLVIESQLRF